MTQPAGNLVFKSILNQIFHYCKNHLYITKRLAQRVMYSDVSFFLKEHFLCGNLNKTISLAEIDVTLDGAFWQNS